MQKIGHEGAADRVDQADKQRRDEGAADRADAADGDDDEGGDQNIFAHADLHGEDRRLHQAGEARERRAEPEHQRVEELYVDPERADHFAVGCAGADQHAEPRAHDEDIKQHRDRERHPDDDEAIERIIEPRQDLHRVEHFARQRQRHAGRSPDQPDELVEEQQQAERAEHVIEMIAAVEPPYRDHFKRHADGKRGGDREHGAEHETIGPFGKRRGEIGAEHIERAVRQIDRSMMPKISVNPAASRNSSMPSWMPLRSCSMK